MTNLYVVYDSDEAEVVGVFDNKDRLDWFVGSNKDYTTVSTVSLNAADNKQFLPYWRISIDPRSKEVRSILECIGVIERDSCQLMIKTNYLLLFHVQEYNEQLAIQKALNHRCE